MTPGFHMENKTFNQMFDRVSAKLTFSYGILTAEETNDPNTPDLPPYIRNTLS